MNINEYYADKLSATTKINKILCIIEGQTELSFLKKVYELYNEDISCKDFFLNIVKVSWGKSELVLKNAKCNFQGGNLKGCPTPMPVIESLEKEDLEIYSSIIVCFDKDRDSKNIVENYARNSLKNLNHKFLLSSPCFENTVLHLCNNTHTHPYVLTNYMIIDDSLCQWYKDKFNRIPKDKKFSRCQKAQAVIEIIDKNDLLSVSNSDFKDFINFLVSEMA